MAGVVSALRTGFNNFLGRFGRVYQNPAETEGGSVLGMQPYYRLLWSYYDNSAFENTGAWSPYLGRYHLYRAMSLLYNPTQRLCDFYATHIYPGLLTANPAELPDEIALAVPLADDTTPEMRAALDQLWLWSRWQANKSVLCRYGAVAGNVLLECVDDVDEGRVYLNIVWPSLVSYLDLDPTGTILAYTLQYPARNDDGTFYEYRKMVDRQQIQFFKDDQPFDYGEGTSYANPYGFVPATWIKHKDLGGNSGAPAIYGSIGKIDQLNSLASHVKDQIHKVIGAPVVLWADGGIGSLFSEKAQQKRVGREDPTTDIDREGLLMLKGPMGGRVDTLAGQLQLHEAAEHLTMLLTEIEADHPEVAMYRELRKMSQVTGPAATRLMGDVVAAVDESAANYDAGCVQAFAMCLAIGGWRANTGDWPAPLRPEQAVFLPFNLDQLSSGALHVRILPRPLIATSVMEQLEIEQMRNTIKSGVVATLAANLRESPPQ